MSKDLFIDKLNNNQKQAISKLIDESKIRKTVYTSSSGDNYKYADHIKEYVYSKGYVPIHPVDTLGYYISSKVHKDNKKEIMADCFSLLKGSDELWVFSPKKYNIITLNNIHELSEGVLSEIYWWLKNKTKSKIRFITFEEIGIPKYSKKNKWEIVPTETETERKYETTNSQKFGLIDVGSSTVKLFICSIDTSGISKILDKKSITVNLAEDFFEDNILKELPMIRTVEAINDFRNDAIENGVEDIKVFGTGVMVKAENESEFSKKIYEKCGMNIEKISGKDEAELVYKVIKESFYEEPDNFLVVNAGGGTTDVIYKENRIKDIYNLQIGISELIKKYTYEYPMEEDLYEDAKKFIKEKLDKEISKDIKCDLLIYTGGELDYMIKTGFPLRNYSNSLTHPKQINIKDFKDYSSKMRKLNLDELHAYMPENPKWMNGAIASNTLLETLSEYFGVDLIIPSNKNLNDGILLEMLKSK